MNDLCQASNPDASRKADSLAALSQDAVAALRGLKRKHRNLFDKDPKGFRRQVRKAEGRVLSLKRGPKPDPLIAKAARDIATGKSFQMAFQDLYPSTLKTTNPDLYAMALENFRTKVNCHIRRHPYLKRMRDRRANQQVERILDTIRSPESR